MRFDSIGPKISLMLISYGYSIPPGYTVATTNTLIRDSYIYIGYNWTTGALAVFELDK